MNKGRKSKTASRIALLAPVPIRHLESAPDTIKAWGKVAFGSNKFEVFDTLDKERNNELVDVYIYASHDGGRFYPEIWLARYIESGERCYPNLRPASTNSDTPFGIYRVVDELRQVGSKKHLHVAELTAYGKDKPYGTRFVPEGPMLINHP
jgi:hypothetical protein